MAKAKNLDMLREPVFIALELYQRQMENLTGQFVKPLQPQRQRRLGELPAEPIIESAVDMIAEEEM